MELHQLNLFSDSEIKSTSFSRPPALLMDADALARWKAQIAAHQQRIGESQPVQQTTLFDVASAHCDPNKIDPFSLPLQSMAFYRMPTDNFGQAAIYFVIDSAAQLVLYIGETCRSNKRWKGNHDCKHYIEKYQDLHYQYGLSCAVNMTFWWDAPMQTRPRQQLELALIQRWLAPFNKQNWDRWGQPFGK